MSKITSIQFFIFYIFSQIYLINAQDLLVNIDTLQAPNLYDFGLSIKQDIEKVYPPIRDLLYTETYLEPDVITVNFIRNYDNANPKAFSDVDEKIIYANASYYQDTEDSGSLIHELVHIILQYKNCPWISEGMADYMKYKFYQPNAILIKPSGWAGHHYSNDSNAAAYFLKWLESKSFEGESITFWLNNKCREGDYVDSLFEDWTGKSIDDNWKEMLQSVPPSGFRVEIDSSNAPDLADFALEVKAALEEWYPKIKELLFSPTFEELDFMFVYFHPNIDTIGYTDPVKKYFVGGASYFRNHTWDIGVIINGMTRMIQQFKTGPKWLHDGLLDYIRFYIYEWYSSIEKPPPGSHYTDGGMVAGYFLGWLDDQYQPWGSSLSYWLSKDCREGTHKEEDFVRLTGKRLDDLWNQMAIEEGL